MKALRLQVFWILAPFLYAGGDSFVGLWKLDSHRSKFSRGDPSFMFATMQIELSGNGLKSTAAAADGQGLASNFTFTCTLDGQTCDVVAATPMRGLSAVDKIWLRLLDAHTIMATGTKDGRLVFTDQRVVSADGQTMTVTRKAATPEGRKYQSTIVLIRSR
jgi:hypothetical protein